MVVLAMVCAVKGAPVGSIWAAEPPLQVGHSLFAAPLSLTFASKSSAAAVNGLDLTTIRALRSTGTVERLVVADGGSSIVLDRDTHELRSTAATPG
jgi:hypothetical protein